MDFWVPTIGHKQLVSYAELEESTVFVPSHPSYEDLKEQQVKLVEDDLSPSDKVQKAMECIQCSESMQENSELSFHRRTVLDYSRAYISGEITPLMVAERFIAAVHESSEPALHMSFFIDYNVGDILRQATESTQRYKQGEPLSPLDGVPIAIKDEIDCMPYPTTGGTKWLQKVRHCADDACCVKRLRLCGAILVGKTNMHELGAGTSGINPHYGVPRNPYDPNKVSGGSSSGSAAVVSAGLCPVALGVDGGGSVRMPAALCGVVGLKPTFGLGMVGILAGTVEDAFITYAAISGQFPSCQPTDAVKKINFPLLKTPKCISDIKMAKYGEWFNDCTDDIRVCCSHALDQLHKHYGWETMDVTIPEIEVMRLAHYPTIGAKSSNSIPCHLQNINRLDKVALSVYGSFSSRILFYFIFGFDILRNRQMQFHKKIFAMADVIVTPTTGVTAYPIFDDALKTGELDYINGVCTCSVSDIRKFLGIASSNHTYWIRQSWLAYRPSIYWEAMVRSYVDPHSVRNAGHLGLKKTTGFL
ncbi:Fatty acid amide hydrolase [Camellia lanceoleosa]|uniref:Fatty acid amide hydrolase n=1 Tax=Camellia lanceoleosa TaxID=1840588 RepID=A0ACC0IXY3_9ERIC|nr:Fatty acid amide hydrolase [Camellia lanceoleosa]